MKIVKEIKDYDSFSEILHDAAKIFSDKTYIIEGEKVYTFKDFNILVNKCCRMLERDGVKRGDIVSIILKNSIDYLIITRDEFITALSPLIQEKESLGLTVKIVTIEEINQSFIGRDIVEKMRNCVVNEYESNGIEWLLLVGDADPDTPTVVDKAWEVPSRLIYNPDGSSTIYTITDYNVEKQIQNQLFKHRWNLSIQRVIPNK